MYKKNVLLCFSSPFFFSPFLLLLLLDNGVEYVLQTYEFLLLVFWTIAPFASAQFVGYLTFCRCGFSAFDMSCIDLTWVRLSSFAAFLKLTVDTVLTRSRRSNSRMIWRGGRRCTLLLQAGRCSRSRSSV
jgi:hypothetical protein